MSPVPRNRVFAKNRVGLSLKLKLDIKYRQLRVISGGVKEHFKNAHANLYTCICILAEHSWSTDHNELLVEGLALGLYLQF